MSEFSLHLPNLDNAPPGGWSYVIPETGAVFRMEPSLYALKHKIRDHYRAAGYEMPGDIDAKIEAYICNKVPQYCGAAPRAEDLPKDETGLQHGFAYALQCLRTLVSNVAGSGERVTQEQAESRARTCVACPENQKVEGCSTCNIKALQSLVSKIALAGQTSLDGQLESCKICHCNLRAKIWIKHEAIWKNMPDGQKVRLPPTCWLNTERSNES